MQVKTTVRYHLTQVGITTIKNLQTVTTREGVEVREPSDTVGGHVNWHTNYGEQYGASIKNYN